MASLKDLGAEEKTKVANLLRKVVEQNETNQALQASLDSVRNERNNVQARVSQLRKSNSSLASESSCAKRKLSHALALSRSYQRKLRSVESPASSTSNLWFERDAQAGPSFLCDRLDVAAQTSSSLDEERACASSATPPHTRDIGTSMSSTLETIDACVGTEHLQWSLSTGIGGTPSACRPKRAQPAEHADLLQMVAEAVGDDFQASSRDQPTKGFSKRHDVQQCDGLTENPRQEQRAQMLDYTRRPFVAAHNAAAEEQIAQAPSAQTDDVDAERLIEAIEHLEASSNINNDRSLQSERESLADSYGEELTELIDDLEDMSSCEGEDGVSSAWQSEDVGAIELHCFDSGARTPSRVAAVA
jgi:hypothetical protein